MKKILFFVALFVVSAMFASCEKEEVIPFSKLPSKSQVFVNTHFPDVEVTTVIRDKDGFEKDYTVYLANGFKIDFERNGNWDEIDGFINPLPQSILDLLPAGIVAYVTANFPNNTIVAVDRERFGYEIRLSGTRLELKFNHNGGFIGFDD